MASKISVRHKTLDKWLTKASLQLQQENYERAIATCHRVLQYVSDNEPKRAEALRYIGTAHAMSNENQEAYEAFSRAIEIEPDQFDLWFNRGQACLYTCRAGQALKDFRMAGELCTIDSFKQRILGNIEFAEKAVKTECELRGPDFTLEKLIEQEESVQLAVVLMNQGSWPNAEKRLRDAIAMGDVLPQPWGNLGLCLLMQQRYEEAEEALNRALEIDPDYKLARRNLAMLDRVRSGEIAPRVHMSDPFVNARRSINFYSE